MPFAMSMFITSCVTFAAQPGAESDIKVIRRRRKRLVMTKGFEGLRGSAVSAG
jgi:hypothetical protein